jgi:Lysylphosphatidylglycerol synthase TM region
MSRIVHLLALIAGAVGFLLLVDRVGWAAMGDAVTEAGWWFAWIALIDLASVISDAGGVYCFVRAEADVPYWRVFAAQASGIAINRLTPANSLGEAIKVTMLADHVPKSVAVSSIVKFNLATLYVALAVVVIGVPLTLLGLDLPRRLEIMVWIGTAGIVVAAGLLALLLHRGAVATLVGLLRRVRVISAPRAATWTSKVQTLDASIRAFGNPWSRRGVACVVGSRVLHFAATIAVLRAAHVPMTPPIVIGMLSVGIVVQWMSSIVPLGLGLADGTNYILYGALGSSPLAGLAFTMVNRTRTVVLAAMGLAVMAITNLYDRSRPASEQTSDTASEPRTEAGATP